MGARAYNLVLIGMGIPVKIGSRWGKVKPDAAIELICLNGNQKMSLLLDFQSSAIEIMTCQVSTFRHPSTH